MTVQCEPGVHVTPNTDKIRKSIYKKTTFVTKYAPMTQFCSHAFNVTSGVTTQLNTEHLKWNFILHTGLQALIPEVNAVFRLDIVLVWGYLCTSIKRWIIFWMQTHLLVCFQLPGAWHSVSRRLCCKSLLTKMHSVIVFHWYISKSNSNLSEISF